MTNIYSSNILHAFDLRLVVSL